MSLGWGGGHPGDHCLFPSPFTALAPEPGPGPQGLGEEKALVGKKKIERKYDSLSFEMSTKEII